jgi:stage II sporulation protein D
VVQRTADGLLVVNEVPLERYVEGILLREVYPGWDAAVLRAQAVVARTYALYRRSRSRPERPWDLTASDDSQVYGGIAAEAPEARRAVAATRAEVLVFEGRPILAAYHSASGGRTASAQEVWGRAVPYLVSVPVEGEELSPDTYWRISVSTATLGRALVGLGWSVGRVEEIRVAERSSSGRVRRVSVRGNGESVELSGRDLRRAAGGLPSTLFEVRREGDGYLFVGSGHGHGVGMSQWGARAMAQHGASYREILAKFYPGVRIHGEWGAGEEL